MPFPVSGNVNELRGEPDPASPLHPSLSLQHSSFYVDLPDDTQPPADYSRHGASEHVPYGGINDLGRSTSDSSPTSQSLTRKEPLNPISAIEESTGTPYRESVTISSMFRYATCGDKTLMIIGTICAIAAGAGMPAFSFVFGRIMSDLMTTTSNAESATAKTALIMIYVGIGMMVASGGHVLCWTIAAARQIARIRMYFFEAVLRQDIGWHDEHTPGELTSRMTGDTRVIQNGINDKLSQGIMNASMGILGFAFGFFYCWELTLMMLGMMPFIAITAALIGNVMTKMTERSRQNFAKAGSLATEVMENIRTVQTFGKEDYEVARFHEAVLLAEADGIKKEFSSTITTGIIMALVYITYVLAFFFSAFLVKTERATMEKTTSTFLSVLMGSFGIGFVSPSATALAEACAAAFEIYKAIDRVPPVDIDAGGKSVTGFREAMDFRHLKFAYPTRPDMVLFRDLCLTIKRGQKVAFSGASGCGKSSMIGLIQRFYDPIGGEVLCDGVDMRELNLREWRDQIGIVSQEPNLFSGTMMENVRVGKEDATEEEVIEACKQANIHDTIMTLPEQYNTPVGSVGSQLSGGQKQRIAIARALVKRPAILLLDEATSALDRKSEMEVQAALDALMASTNMTVVVIAHRLATIRHVDCIYYIAHDGEKGSYIEEEGTFDVLMQRGGAFAAMAKSQGVMPRVASNLSESSCGEDGGGARTRGRGYTQILGEAELAQLDREKPRTERQMIALDKLAAWEIGSTHVSPWRLLLLNRSYAWALVLALFGSIIAGAIAPVNTILLGKLMNALAEYKFTHDEDALHRTVNRYAPAFVGIAAAALGGWLLQFFYGYAGEHLTTRLRTWLFQQILRQDMSFFDTPNRDAGVLSGMLSGDCEAIQQLCGAAIGIRIQSACTIAVGVLIAFLYQWKIALVSLGCVPLIVIASLMQQLMLIGANRYEEGSSDDTVATEALSNVRTIASFNLQLNRLARFSESMERENPSTIRRNVLVGIIYGASQFVYYGAFALCYWYGGKLITQGEADFESVNVASLAILMGATSAGEAGGFAAKLGDAKSAVKRVFSIIDRVPDVDIQDPARTQVVPLRTTDYPLGCQVDVQRTHFIYPARPNQVVLQSLDLHIPPGSTVGMTGQTGCGKSTLIQLLSCFYAARRGDVLLNGTSISALSIGLWRQHISVVLQEPDLFSGTVRDNITYALTEDELANTTQQDVERVATWACIHDDVMAMPEGYDTDVGYKGRSLSGGQKQRVAIARGLLRPGVSLLLLDEATSALDNATEARVQRGIEAYMDVQNQAQTPVTVMSIAHRLTTIRYFDQIVLMDAGRIVEQGTHEELMKLGGEYQTRWELFAAGISV